MNENNTEIVLKGPIGDISVVLGNIDEKLVHDCMGAIVIPFTQEGFVMAFHKKRNSWEFPGGKREKGETLDECISREALEEAGAILKNRRLIGYYLVKDLEGNRKAAIYKADIERFVDKPKWSEMGEVRIFRQLPENLSYKDGVYEIVIKYIEDK